MRSSVGTCSSGGSAASSSRSWASNSWTSFWSGCTSSPECRPDCDFPKEISMSSHIRSNLLLLVLTVFLCCFAYPAVLLVIGQTVFHHKAEGSLLYDRNGHAIGSRLIAQPFSAAGYFQPRPSAVSYNGAASGAS